MVAEAVADSSVISSLLSQLSACCASAKVIVLPVMDICP